MSRSFKQYVKPDEIAKVRDWFATRGGCVQWHNQEIGANRPEVMTPARNADGTPTTAPHWAYGAPTPISAEDIGVRDEKTFDPSAVFPDAFHKCTFCNGTGRYSLTSIAKARQNTLASVVAEVNNGADWASEYNPTDLTVKCSACQGTGRTDREIRVSLRRGTWGYELTATGKERAEAWCKRLAKAIGHEVKWDWQNVGYGKGALVFYTEVITPFVL